MGLYLAKSRFNFVGQAEWKKEQLEGECLRQLRLILLIVNELAFEFICHRAATEITPHPLNDLFRLTATRSSPLLPKAHISIFSDKICVRFEITEGVYEIDVTEICTGSGPSGGGGHSIKPPNILPTDPTSRGKRYSADRAGEWEYDRVAARTTINLAHGTSWCWLNAKSEVKLPRHDFVRTDIIAVLKSFWVLITNSIVVRSALNWTTKWLRKMYFDKPIRDNCMNSRCEFDSYTRLRETLVQSADFDSRKAFEIALNEMHIDDEWKYRSDCAKLVRRIVTTDDNQDVSNDQFNGSIFFFGVDCLSARDKETIAVAATEKSGRARIFIHSSDNKLKQKNSVDLILAAAISKLREQDITRIFVECDGHVPFCERDDVAVNSALSVWRRVFKTRHVLASGTKIFASVNSHFEFMLNDDAQKAITDYYSVACERFASGMKRDDVYVWRELAHWIGRDQYWPELSIVLRDVTKNECEE